MKELKKTLAGLFRSRGMGVGSGRRVPFLQQLNGVECGTACLAMILSYHGRQTSVAEGRELCRAGRDGVSARAIAEAARECGLRVRAFSAEPGDFKYLPLPAVAHWAFNHFVVVEKWTRRGVSIVDPAEGRRECSHGEFALKFTGVVLTFQPGVNFQTRRRARGFFWLQHLRGILCAPGVRPLLARIIFTSLLLQVLGLALPLFTKVVVDSLLPFGMKDVLTVLGIGMVCLVAGQVLVSYLRNLLLIFWRGRLDSQLMLGFFEHLMLLPFRYFQERANGDLLMRLGSNNLIREAVTNQTLSLLLDGLFVVAYAVLLFTQAPLFGMVVLSLGVVELLVLFYSHRSIRHLSQRTLAAEAEEQSYLTEVIQGMQMVKASGMETRVTEHWTALFFKQLDASVERDRGLAKVESAVGALRMFSPLLLLWVGASMVQSGSMSLGTMLALNTLGMAFLTPLSTLVSSWQQLQLVGAHLERIADVLTSAPEQESQTTRRTRDLSGRVALRNVSFRYDKESPPVLSDISFSIEPGQKIALVGPTGCGKSTLAKLLLGLYPPDGGEILYDGVPLASLDYRSLRGRIGVVLQESFLFYGSIRQNIAFGDSATPLGEIIEAAKLAAIHDEIVGMPLGYDTMVTEGGASLSGGQRQRLSIARALIRRPAVAILDEATSHLDVLTENRVEANLSRLACTRIVIAHRLSSIRDADKIIVLDRGRVVEHGVHEELLNSSNFYMELVSKQFAEQASPAPAH